MLKRSKKLVSILTAATMLSSLLVPIASAQEEFTLESEIAALDAAGDVIAQNDFEGEAEAKLLSVVRGSSAPAAYTAVSPLSITIGSNRVRADEETNASIITAPTADNATKALELAYASLGSVGAEVEFVVSGSDMYKVAFEAYPVSGQDMVAILAGGNINLGLEADTWNTVEMYVAPSGRVVNVNDRGFVVYDDVAEIPKLSGI